MSWAESEKLNEWIERAYQNGKQEEQERIIKLLEEDCGCHDLHTCIAHSFIALIKGENK